MSIVSLCTVTASARIAPTAMVTKLRASQTGVVPTRPAYPDPRHSSPATVRRMTAPMTDFVTAHAAARPTDPAVIEGEVTTTWDEFERRANRWANVLGTLGVRPGTKL